MEEVKRSPSAYALSVAGRTADKAAQTKNVVKTIVESLIGETSEPSPEVGEAPSGVFPAIVWYLEGIEAELDQIVRLIQSV